MITLITKESLAADIKGWLFAQDFVRPSVYIGEMYEIYTVRIGWLKLKKVTVSVPKIVVTVVTTKCLTYQEQIRLERFAGRMKPVGVSMDFDYFHE